MNQAVTAQKMLLMSFFDYNRTETIPKMPYYFTRIVKGAKNAWEDRKAKEGKAILCYNVLSVEFLQYLQITSNADQLCDMFFESPSHVDFSGITEKCVNEQEFYMLRDERSF